MKPVFKNRENTLHKIGNKDIRDSRSCAVNAVVLGLYKDDIFALVEKRSGTMEDEPGKWCVPCGYFDWDEDGLESITREVYEETGLYLPNFKNNLVFGNREEDNENDFQPFYVRTSPKVNRQNISLYYIFIYDFSNGLPSVEEYKNEEVEVVKWLEISKVYSSKYIWAFGHDEIIEKAVVKFEKYLV